MRLTHPHIIFLAASLFLVKFGDAQQQVVDSIKNVLKTEKEDTNKVSTLNELSQSLNRISDYRNADSAAFTALSLAQRLNYKTGASFAYINIGVDHFRRGNYPKAIENYLAALRVAEESHDKKDIGLACHRLGNAYDVMGDYTKALLYFYRALKERQAMGDKQGEAHTLNGIGEVHRYQQEYTQALNFYKKALEINEKINNRLQEAYNLGNMGLCYHQLKDYALAMEYENKAIVICTELGDKENLSEIYNDMGLLYLDQEKYTEAIDCENKSLNLAKEIGARDDIKGAYKALSEIYEKKGDIKSELSYYKAYVQERDSIYNQINAQQITSDELTYQYEKKMSDEKAERDKRESLQKEKTFKQQVAIYFIGGILVLVLAFVVFMARSLRISRRKTKIIQKQKEEMERLAIVARETGNIILILDADGRIEWANESFTRINGITIEQLKKMKGETIFEISNNPHIKEYVHAAVTQKKSVVYESLNRNRQGSLVWESSTLTPIFDESGKVRKLIIVDTDVTERKEAEEIIRQKNKDITDSINYARRIQRTMLPTIEDMGATFSDFFVLYKPKDIVSGDFYYFTPPSGTPATAIICAADCTGHGVPGALMSMVGIDLLHHIVVEKNIKEPGLILSELHDGVRAALKQNVPNSETFDGMDVAMCAVDLNSRQLQYAGALRNLYIIRKNKALEEIAADKQSIGGVNSITKKQFKNNTIELQQGDTIYLTSDGYADQFGSEKNKKLTTKKFKDLLLSIQDKTMKEQGRVLDTFIENWKGKLEQVDDILVIGIRV